jgi:hypothetical protein
MRKGRTKPAFKPFPKERTPAWSRQKIFMMLSDRKQEQRSPFLFGDSKALYGQAKFISR